MIFSQINFYILMKHSHCLLQQKCQVVTRQKDNMSSFWYKSIFETKSNLYQISDRSFKLFKLQVGYLSFMFVSDRSLSNKYVFKFVICNI
jgi:hypothetical protein